MWSEFENHRHKIRNEGIDRKLKFELVISNLFRIDIEKFSYLILFPVMEKSTFN